MQDNMEKQNETKTVVHMDDNSKQNFLLKR